MEYDVTPEEYEVNTCEGVTPNYEQRYPRYEGGVTTDYPIIIEPFSPHNLVDCVYNGSNNVVGRLKCSGSVDIQCLPPLGGKRGRRCGVDTDTEILHAEW